MALKELSEERIKQGTNCPFCDSEEIVLDSSDEFGHFTSGNFHNMMKCENCGKSWTEKYILVSIF